MLQTFNTSARYIVLRRLYERDTQIEKLHQRLTEQENLNAEQNNRLADQNATIEEFQQRLRKHEPESDSPFEIMENAFKSLASNDRAYIVSNKKKIVMYKK